MKTKRILILEDDKAVQDSLAGDYRNTSFIKGIGPVILKTRITDKDGECYSLYEKNFYDLLIIDLFLYGKRGGLQVLEKIRQKDQLTPIMVLSGLAEREDMPKIGKHANTYFFDKTLGDPSGNQRYNLSIKCLVDGQSNFRKTHKDFYLPVCLAEALSDCDLYSSRVLKDNWLTLLRYYRNPDSGFNSKGLIGLLNEVCDVVEENLAVICQNVLKPKCTLDFARIKKALTGLVSLKNMEQFLSIDSRYREHFVHQFQNFLLGCLLYDRYRTMLNPALKRMFCRALGIKRMTNQNLQLTFEVAWFFTTMFHDFAYPMQLYDTLMLHYFRENYRYRFQPSFVAVEPLYVREGIDVDLEAIERDFWSGRLQSESFRLLLGHEFMNRNHGVHSAVALRRLIRYHATDEILCRFFAPIVSAIALHDWAIWSHARSVRKALLSKSKKSVDQTESYQYECDFDAGIQMNPLLHMLLMVDNIQDWGRPKGGEPFFKSTRLELVSISEPGKSKEEPLELELDAREGLKLSTTKTVFNNKVSELDVLCIILGDKGLPVTVKLNRGIDSKKPDQETILLRT